MKTFRATAASTSARWGELDANLEKILKAVEKAAGENSRLLLLPECSLTGGYWPTDAKTPTHQETALELDCPALKEIARTAKKTGIVVCVGFLEKWKGGLRISQALIGPKGMLGVYRKVHEGKNSSDDHELFPVFDLGFVRVGISICRDNMLPECARILALKGAELLLAPFMSLPLSRKAWELMRLVALRARAQDNRLFVLSASSALPHVKGRPSEWGYSGICCAVNPLGEVMGISKGKPGTPQSLALTLTDEIRRTYLIADVPSTWARRPLDYGELSSTSLQKRLVQNAPPFEYNKNENRLTVAKTKRASSRMSRPAGQGRFQPVRRSRIQ